MTEDARINDWRVVDAAMRSYEAGQGRVGSSQLESGFVGRTIEGLGDYTRGEDEETKRVPDQTCCVVLCCVALGSLVTLQLLSRMLSRSSQSRSTPC